MKLTIDLPATTTDLRNYLDACELLGVETIADNETDGDGGLVVQLVADTASTAAPAAAEPPAAAPPKSAKKATPKTAPKAGKGGAGGRGALGNDYLAILRHLATHGTFAGNSTALAKAAGLNIDDASKVVNRMQRAGDVTFTKNGQRIAAIAITNKGRDRVAGTLAAAPTPPARPLASVPAARPAPAPAPAAPAPVPPGGLKAPAGGWA